MNAKQNANIARARFHVQLWNHDKTTKQLMEIYSVSRSTAQKMRREEGVLSQQQRLNIKKEEFLQAKEHHGLTIKQIQKIYGVKYQFATNLKNMVVKSLVMDRRKNLDKLIYSHPNFGHPGEPAPVSIRALAEDIGCSREAVAARRNKRMVCRHVAQRKVRAGSSDVMAYKTCKLTHSWGRPAGIDRYLEGLRE